MKAATLRTFLAVHTWVGLAAGMALFIAFYAGSITVFEHELMDWQRSGEHAAEHAAPPQSIDQAQSLVDRVLAQHPEAAHAFTVVLPGEHGPKPTLYWFNEKAEGGAKSLRFQLADNGQLAMLPGRSGFVDFIYDLHFTAGLPRTFGIYLFGVVCILYGLALVSGVVIYTPNFLRDLFALRWGKNLKRLWQDAHNVIGMLSLPFHIIFAWSGAVLTIGFIMLAPFQFLVYENKLLEVLEADFEVAPHVEPAGVKQPLLSLETLIEKGRVALPAMQTGMVSYHDVGDANAQVTLFGETPQRRLTNTGAVALNGASGQVLRVVQPETFTPGMSFLRGLQSLHYGNFGHTAVKWLYFLLGMAGAFLFYSGNLLWIEARRKRRSDQQPGKTRFVARLTICVCLGSMIGISGLFLANKLLPAELLQRDVWEVRSYYALFFAAMLWAFARPPARAAYELLMACALLTAAIPVANALFTGNGMGASWTQGQWNVFGVDAVALLLALAYWRMAVATLRRGQTGDPNSVWALPAARQSTATGSGSV
jgi:uncharacterized iron-regulated membrane protein